MHENHRHGFSRDRSELRQHLHPQNARQSRSTARRACSRNRSELNLVSDLFACSRRLSELIASLTFWLVSMAKPTADYADANRFGCGSSQLHVSKRFIRYIVSHANHAGTVDAAKFRQLEQSEQLFLVRLGQVHNDIRRIRTNGCDRE